MLRVIVDHPLIKFINKTKQKSQMLTFFFLLDQILYKNLGFRMYTYADFQYNYKYHIQYTYWEIPTVMKLLRFSILMKWYHSLGGKNEETNSNF